VLSVTQGNMHLKGSVE